MAKSTDKIRITLDSGVSAEAQAPVIVSASRSTDIPAFYADYVLFEPDRKPLAVIEAKRRSVNPTPGEHQAELYADCLEKKYGMRPVIYFTNGFKRYIVDRLGFPKREISAFHSLDDLQVLHHRQGRADIIDMSVKQEISRIYYQIVGIHARCDHFNKKHSKGFLVMSTGTGKKRTAVSLVFRANSTKSENLFHSYIMR